MITPEDCLQYAAECERLAGEGNARFDRDRLRGIADRWRELAAEYLVARPALN